MQNYLGVDCTGWVNLVVSKAPDQRVFDALGYVPGFIDANDPRPLTAQLEDRYRYFSSWKKIASESADPNTARFNPSTGAFKYPGDPALYPHAKFELNGETCYAYQSAIFIVVDKDGVAWQTRMD